MLLRKMLRDMRLQLSQFVSIFVMAMLGVFIFTGINSEWYGMQTEADRYYAETNLADIWMTSQNFSAENEDEVKKTSGVIEVERRLVLDGIAELAGNPVLRVNVVDENKISRPFLVEGTVLSPEKDGIWLDYRFASAHRLKPGDAITVKAGGRDLRETISGLIMHPEYVHSVKDETELIPNPQSFGFAFLPRSAIQYGALLPYNQMLIELDGEADPAVVKTRLEEVLAGNSGITLTRNDHPSVAMFNSEIEQNKAMGGVFPIVFFLIAALTMLTTMTRMVSGQRTQIGTLKALGFSRRKILGHYISYGFWVGLAGGLAGLIAGPLILPPILFSMQEAIYSLPSWRAAISLTDILAAVLAVVACVMAGYLACRRELGETPSAALRPRIPKTSRHTRLEKSAFWLRLGFSFQWNIRDILRNKIRSIMAVVGVLGCMTLLLFALGLHDTVGSVTGQLYDDINIFESKISLEDDLVKEELDALLLEFPGQLVQETRIELKSGERVQSGMLTVTGEGDRFRPEDAAGNKVRLADRGAALSAKMQQYLKVSTGSEIQWRKYGDKTWQSTTVSLIYRTPLGQGMVMSESAYEQDGNTLIPTALLTISAAGETQDYPGVKGVQSKQQLIDSFGSMLDSILMIILLLILAAVVLGTVVLYNLGALAFYERTREMATLRVLGFSSRKIQSLSQKQNIWLTIPGILAGIPASYGLIIFMLQTMPDSSDFSMYISPLSLALCSGVTLAISISVNLLMSIKVKGIDMVSSLKSVD